MEKTDALQRLIAPGLILALFLNPLAHAQQTASPQTTDPSAEQATSSQGSTGTATADSPQPVDNSLPDSPGSVQQPSEKPATPSTSNSPTQSTPAQTSTQQSQAQHGSASQPPPNEPRGTAAAEAVPTSGIAASRPAGAALAPAKQRRVRSILIKVGALAGVGVAIGTAMALSKGSPSKPPGTN